jgi:hypothetical protein
MQIMGVCGFPYKVLSRYIRPSGQATCPCGQAGHSFQVSQLYAHNEQRKW